MAARLERTQNTQLCIPELMITETGKTAPNGGSGVSESRQEVQRPFAWFMG
jgi:hypothetical protein